MGSLSFEHGDLKYMSNTNWSTQTHCASLEGLQLLAPVMELRGNLCKVWGGTRLPVPAVRVPGPGQVWCHSWLPLLPAPAVSGPGQGRGRVGRERWEHVALWGQKEAVLSIGCLCVWYICLHAHTRTFQVLVCHRRRRVKNRVVQDRNGPSFLLISFLCLCGHAAMAGNDGYRKGDLWYDGKIHISSAQGRCTKAACRSVFPGTWVFIGFS